MKNELPYYDEVFDKGRVRPAYREFWPVYLGRKQIECRQRITAARRAFDNDADVLAVPRLLTRQEYRELAKGVAQRGRGIQKFLNDFYFGKGRDKQNKVIPRARLNQIVSRTHENHAKNLLRPENLQFWYAPDLFRDSLGQFRVVEDNTGFVGGLGDLRAVQNAGHALGLKMTGDALLFYRRMAQLYRRDVRSVAGGKIVVLNYPPEIRTTHEDARMAKLFLEVGISTIHDFGSLQLAPSGVYLRGQRVGLVILNRDCADVDPQEPKLRRRYLNNVISDLGPRRAVVLRQLLRQGKIHEVEEKLKTLFEPTYFEPIKKSSSVNFWQLVREGKVAVSSPPGIEFTNDKQFYRYVDKIIEVYLDESSLLKSIETVCFDDKSRINSTFRTIKDFVVKGVCGRGGEEVWIGHLLSSRQVKNLKARVTADRGNFIAQRYVEPSRLVNHSVDLRLFAMITPETQIVSPVIWGRGIPVGSHGKVNIAAGGKLTAVAVV